MAHYAWSHIRHHDSENGRHTIKPGTKVSAGMLGMSDEEFDELVESGAVREDKWPEGLNPDNPSAPSPNQYRLQQLREQREKLEAEIRGASEQRGPSREDQQREAQGQ